MRYGHHPVSGAAAAAAVWLALIPLSTLVTGADWLLQVLPVLLVPAAVGLALGLLRAPRLATLTAQLVAVGAVLVWRGLAVADPGGGWLTALRRLTADGVAAIRAGVPPMALTPGLGWLVLLLAGVLLIVVSLLVDTLEQPGWSVVPLALPYGIAAITQVDDLGVALLLPVVAGYLLLLFSSAGTPAATGAVSRRAAFEGSRLATVTALGAGAVALSLVLALVIPLGEKHPWTQGGPDGPIQLTDPTVHLEEDLRRPKDTPVLTYVSDDGEPHYLRTVALSDFSDDGLRLVPMQLNRFGLDRASSQPGREVTLDVTMGPIRSEYLPAAFTPRRIDAAGEWLFDPATLTLVASGADRTAQTINLDYSVTSVVPTADRDEIATAAAGAVDDPVYLTVPSLSPEVTALTNEVVAGATTAGGKALAIQDFLRSDEFTYTLTAPTVAANSVLDAFLLEDRSGYCIHFAAAMVAMARMEGIGARMAIGFTGGTQLEDGSYEVSSHDAHAWPELYFDSLGWIPFEPTPAFDGAGMPDPTATPTTTGGPSASPTGSETTTAPPTTATPTPTPGTGGQGGGSARVALIILTVLLGIAVLGCVPAVVRVVVRLRRLRPGQSAEAAIDGAWAEAGALFADYALAWPSVSPGRAAAATATQLPPQGAAAFAALGATLERSRFSRDGDAGTQVTAQVTALRHAIDRAATPAQRLRARFLPRSLWPGRR